jgi:hypothetical protein
MMKKSLEQTKYPKHHLNHVMNLDFEQPTEKMIAMSEAHGIDLRSPAVIEEFKKI